MYFLYVSVLSSSFFTSDDSLDKCQAKCAEIFLSDSNHFGESPLVVVRAAQSTGYYPECA